MSFNTESREPEALDEVRLDMVPATVVATELKVTTSVLIRRPVIEVFERVADVAHATNWVPFCRSSRQLKASSDRRNKHGMGLGMEAEFTFEVGLIPVVVRQEITEFKWGRKIAFVTDGLGNDLCDVPGNIAAMLNSAIVGTTPRTHVLFSFQSAGSSTLLTVDLAAWIAGLGTVELARPVAADLLVQALSRLKFSIENSDPLPNTYSIFVNYRRRAIRYASGRIYAALVAEFGQGAVFRDIESLKGGTLFPVDLEATIQRCPIVIAMIGPTWVRDLAARREPDWVRIELEHALKRKKSDTAHVIPLLVGVRQFPATEVKGTELEALGDWNAMRVRPDPDFRADMQRLIDRIWEILPPTSLPDAVRRDGPGGPAPRQGIAPEYP